LPAPHPRFDTALLEIRGLTVDFDGPRGRLPVVRGVDLSLAPGEILGLVGESGSGKSLTCLSAMRLLPEGARAGGQIRFEGRDLLTLPEAELVALRGSALAMIGQEPASALNPVRTIGHQLAEALAMGGGKNRGALLAEAEALLRQVGMPDPAARLRVYPHQISGGQCQRAMIAMMIARRPRLLLADEPTTALDVTVQAQILQLLRGLRRTHRMAILLVTHDLGVVAELCDRVAVMYAGRIVESGSVAAVFRRPLHPYTAGLLAARPRIDRRVASLASIPGSPPRPLALPPGCAFAPRCAHAAPACDAGEPGFVHPEDGHGAACLRPLEAVGP